MKFFKPRGRGSLIGLQSPGYQLIWGKVDEYAEHIAELSGHTRERVESVLKEVRSALENRIWRLIPYPKYDYSWALLHQVRALLCQEIPLPRLVASVVDEIAGDLDYLTGSERVTAKERVTRLREDSLH